MFRHLTPLIHFCVQEREVRRHQLQLQNPQDFRSKLSTNSKVDESQCRFRVQPYLSSLPNAICAWRVLWMFGSYLEVIGNVTLPKAKECQEARGHHSFLGDSFGVILGFSEFE